MFQEFMAFCVTQNTCNHCLIYRHAHESDPTLCQVIEMTTHLNWRVQRWTLYLRWAKTEGSYSLLQNGPTLLIDIFVVAKLRLNFLLQNGPKLWLPRIFHWVRKEAGPMVTVTY